MRSFTFYGAATLVAVYLILGSTALSIPTALQRRNAIRGVSYGVWQIYDAVKEYLKDKNAYDPDVPDKCVLRFGTWAGGSCTGKVDCGELDGGRILPTWNVCYLNGRQFFSDPNIGDFSITYTRAGGVDGDTQDGLHHPVLQFAGINDWEEMKVQDILDAQGDSDTGNICKKESGGGDGKSLGWDCAVPILTRDVQSLFGLANLPADGTAEGYTPGWCTARVIQYQKNEFGNGPNYAFVAQIFDGMGTQIGHLEKTAVDDQGYLSMSSHLPYMLVFHVGAVDADPVEFCYAGTCWTCDDSDGGDHYCTLGNGQENGYENGDREGEFGFTC